MKASDRKRRRGGGKSSGNPGAQKRPDAKLAPLSQNETQRGAARTDPVESIGGQKHAKSAVSPESGGAAPAKQAEQNAPERKAGGRFASFLREHRAALFILLLLLAVRLIALDSLGRDYGLQSDDLSYLKSGIYFAKTGTLIMHEEYPSAQIMPGMTWLIALFVRIFGEGDTLWLSLKLLWIAMGTLTAWFVYRSVNLFAPKWCAVVPMLFLFREDFVWMDNLILTETPFQLSLAAMVYFTLRMGRKGDWGSFWGCLISYMAGLMLKANIVLYPLFAFVYLLIAKYDRKLLAKQCAVVAAAGLCFVIPWSLRNYHQFHAFIPLTYGAGNPTLLGTYQGQDYPADEELDYETNVEAVVRERYADYYQEDGTVQPRYTRYVSLQRDAIQARYRQEVWFHRNPRIMLYSYLFLKPKMLIQGVFYWKRVFDTPRTMPDLLQQLDWYACIFAVAASWILRRKRLITGFLAITYLGNVYLYAMTYAFDRYNASLMCLRFMLIGVGLSLAVPLLARGAEAVRRFDGEG